MSINSSETFQNKITEAERSIKKMSVRSRTISTLRIILFLLLLLGVVFYSSEKMIEAVFLVSMVFIVFFVILVKKHNNINFRLRHAKFIRQINKKELARLEGKFEDIYSGQEFTNELHAYSSDLDIFGDNSIFQLLNRSGTNGGRSKMAEWLSQPSNPGEINKRQEAIKELRDELDWRQDFQANAMHFKHSSNKIDLCLSWLKEDDLVSNNAYFKILGIVLPLLNILALSLFLLGYISYIIPTLSYGINFIIFGHFNKTIGDTFKKTSDSVDILSSYHLMIKMIEEKKFESSLLKEIRNNFDNGNIQASKAIRELRNIFTALESRSNIVYLLVDILLLLDIFWVLKAEKWRRKNAAYTGNWFNAIHELEAIGSMASYSFANPDYTYPTLNGDQTVLIAHSLGHPLIPQQERIMNDFVLREDEKIGIVTGSNMSGKSTFLRTIGVNLVLAFSGAPVCANSLESGPFNLFSSMRTHDSLHEHVSSFYAELQRLKALIELIEKNEGQVFFLLDEILKGTNSHDRHNGARSLILQLLEENCKGLVSTHDLELSEIDQIDPRILNLSFNSTISGDEVIFDYLLSKGVCNSFNATQLMGKMGIKIRD